MIDRLGVRGPLVRVATIELPHSDPGPVLLRGRVVLVDAGRVLLEDEHGQATVEGVREEIPIGAVVEIEARWTGVRAEADVVHLRARAGRPFPDPRGDWLRLHWGSRARIEALRARAEAMRAVRAWMDEHDVLEVETPSMVPSPGLDLHLDAFGIANAPHERWLITSPEYQMKRLLAAGLERVYQTCRCYRRGERGARHEPEFTMLEWYRAFSGSAELMRDTEELVARVAREVLGTTRVRGERGEIDLAPPWERLRVDDAFERLAGVRVEEVLPDETRFFEILAERIEPELGRARPVFLIEWPASMASLARRCPERPERADRFEAFVDAMELCNGFGELTDPVEQRARLERDRRERTARGLPAYPLDERFLAALEEGIPPSGGNALGFDRLVMILLGARSIEDVIAIPSAHL